MTPRATTAHLSVAHEFHLVAPRARFQLHVRVQVHALVLGTDHSRGNDLAGGQVPQVNLARV